MTSSAELKSVRPLSDKALQYTTLRINLGQPQMIDRNELPVVQFY